MINLSEIAPLLINKPLAILPSEAERLAGYVQMGGEKLILSSLSFDYTSRNKPYDVIERVAILPIQGCLVQKLGCNQPWFGMTGYDGIRLNFIAALEDPNVDAIVLDIDSPGGEVAGCFDLCDLIYESRSIKPTWAILSECAYSAAYALASSASVVTVPRTGGTGSIGVLAAHCDLSQALDKQGVKVTLIHYGANKVDGTETQPLSPSALAKIQADVDEMGALFVKTVARNRKLDPDKIIATQATTYLGQHGVNYGLADAVASPDTAFAALLEGIAK